MFQVMNEKRSYINRVLSEHYQVNSIHKAPSWSHDKHYPDLYILDPLALGCNLLCPHDDKGQLSKTKEWTDFSSKKPRLIFGMQKNIWIISRIYRCQKCKKKIRAHSAKIFEQVKHLPADFILSYHCGFSQELYNFIITSVAEGKGTEIIPQSFFQLSLFQVNQLQKPKEC